MRNKNYDFFDSVWYGVILFIWFVIIFIVGYNI